MRNQNVKTGECVYCGESGLLTCDHVPPKNLFPKPRPCNLITVPSCRKCNDSFKLDDEYFRLAVTTGIDKTAFPKEFDLSIEAINKLRNPRKVGFAKTMLASLSKQRVYTPAGLYLGEVGALEIDSTRLENIVSRIIRGLFFFHARRRLPTANRVWTCAGWFLKNNSHDGEFIASVKEIYDALCTQPIHLIGESVFRYSYLLDSDEPDCSAWWLSFYEHKNFIGCTFGPEGRVT